MTAPLELRAGAGAVQQAATPSPGRTKAPKKRLRAPNAPAGSHVPVSAGATTPAPSSSALDLQLSAARQRVAIRGSATHEVISEIFAGDAPLAAAMRFAAVLDGLKQIERRNVVVHKGELRRETTAEHSWHLATMAQALAAHAPPGTDVGRATFMVLVHDVPEILAGDTPAYAPAAAHVGEKEREASAAAALFGMLPQEIAAEWLGVWREFEKSQTPTAKYARALDSIQPLMMHMLSEGAAWREHDVTTSQVKKRVAPIEHDVPSLWPVIEKMLDAAVRRGWLKP